MKFSKPSFKLQFDGLASPNPGEATSGAVCYDSNNKIIFETGEYIGYGTNNQAEYTGLIIGLKKAIELNIKNIIIEGDSLLVINQVLGKWAVQNDKLKKLHNEVKQLLKNFDYIDCKHVYRKHNTYADMITNIVLQSKTSYTKMY